MRMKLSHKSKLGTKLELSIRYLLTSRKGQSFSFALRP